MIHLAFLFALLVFWIVAVFVTVVVSAAVIAAPPYFAGRYLWHRCR